MATTKALKTTYWVTTGFIFLFEGVMPAFTSQTDVAVEGIRHLGYPDYFRVMLSVFKVAGALTLILPFVPARIKEWAYAGFFFTMTSASVSHWVVDGMGEYALFPLFVLSILVISYFTYHRLQSQRRGSVQSHNYHHSAVSGVAQ